MKKYIFKGVCLILLLVLFDFAAGRFFSFLHRLAFEKSPYGLVTEYAMFKVDTEVIIIGSSRAVHHYVPEILSDSLVMSVHNCGKDGAFFLYQCCLIDGILNRIKPKLVIWDIEPACFAESTSADYRLSDLNPFYDENKFCQQVIDQSEPAERYKMISSVYRYNSRLLAYLYKCMFSFGYPKDGYLPIADIENRYPKMVCEKLNNTLKQQLIERFVSIVKKCKIGGGKFSTFFFSAVDGG